MGGIVGFFLPFYFDWHCLTWQWWVCMAIFCIIWFGAVFPLLDYIKEKWLE